MNVPILRTPISTGLIDQLESNLLRQESAIVIAPLYGGKRFVLDHLCERLGARELLLIRLRFEAGGIISSETDALRDAATPPRFGAAPLTSLAEFFRWIESSCQRTGTLAVLVISRLDSLSRDLAIRFLQQIRIAINSPRRYMTAVVTAEAALLDLIVGSKSEFNCGNQYVLQQFDTELFAERFSNYAARLDIQFADPAAALASLYRDCNGSTYLLRQILLNFVDRRLSRQEGPLEFLEAVELERIADRLATPGPRESILFRHAADMIGSSLSSVDELERLFRGEALAERGSPGLLELSGAAFALSSRQGDLAISSPMMEAFLRREFSRHRLGHLHAVHGHFDRAFEHYEAAGDQKVQPLTLHDRLYIQDVLRQLEHAFRRSPREQLDLIFFKAIRLVFRVNPKDAVFEIQRGKDSAWTGSGPLESRVIETLENVLALGRQEFAVGPFVGILLSSDKAIVVREPEGVPVWLQAELFTLLRGYSNALRNLEAAEREAQLELIKQKLEALAGSLLLAAEPASKSTTDRLLLKAAEGLRAIPLVKELEVWALRRDSDSFVNVQNRSSVFARLDALRFDDCLNTEDPTPLRESGPEHSTWLFPLGSSSGAEFGVLKIDFVLPLEVDSDELNEFRLFALQFSAALNSCHFAARIQTALDRFGEPILIVDPDPNIDGYSIAYSNQAALDLFGVGSPDAIRTQLRIEFGDGVDTAFAGQRRVQSITRIAGNPYEGTVVFEPLSLDSQSLGVLVHIQQRSHYADILYAFKALAFTSSRETGIERLAEVFRFLVQGWIRVYRVKGDRLVPTLCVDPDRPSVQERFHDVVLPARSDPAGELTWRAIVDQKPRVVSYQPDRAQGSLFYTPRGLPVLVQRDPSAVELLEKSPGDYWIDFPFPEGKFTIPCDNGLTPERFQMFEILAPLVAERLDHLNRPDLDRHKLQSLHGEICDRLSSIEVFGEIVEQLLSHETLAGLNGARLRRQLHFAMERMRAPLGALANAAEAGAGS